MRENRKNLESTHLLEFNSITMGLNYETLMLHHHYLTLFLLIGLILLFGIILRVVRDNGAKLNPFFNTC